ncbi:MAG: hypothetical protein P1U40_01870 [Coxiellaceae bacterium]|nr:hypothetical protein [Coxiellaceae bacterium]
MNNKQINLLDWRAQRKHRQQITGMALLMLGSVIIIAGLLLLRYQLVQNTQLQLSYLSSVKKTHCDTRQIKKIQQQLDHIQQYKKWWQQVEHHHNQRTIALAFIAQHVSAHLLFNRIAFLDHQWLLEGKASSAYLYQKLLRQLNKSALDYTFKLGEITHTSQGLYRFSLIGTLREKNSVATTANTH